MADETPIEPCESKEGAQFPELAWNRPVLDGLGFDGVHSEASCLETETKVVHFGLFEYTFFWFEKKMMFGKAGENFMDELPMTPTGKVNRRLLI